MWHIATASRSLPITDLAYSQNGDHLLALHDATLADSGATGRGSIVAWDPDVWVSRLSNAVSWYVPLPCKPCDHIRCACHPPESGRMQHV